MQIGALAGKEVVTKKVKVEKESKHINWNVILSILEDNLPYIGILYVGIFCALLLIALFLGFPEHFPIFRYTMIFEIITFSIYCIVMIVLTIRKNIENMLKEHPIYKEDEEHVERVNNYRHEKRL